MRIALADPPAYTPPYDHALAAALARQGVDVRLLTSRFRYGAVPAASGYVLDDSLYRVSVADRPEAVRLAAKARRASFRARAARRSRTAMSSTCSGSRRPRQMPGSCMPARRSSSPRTTSCPGGRPVTRAPGGACSAASTGSSPTASAAAGHSPRSACPTPSCASSRTPPPAASPSARDDGRTVLALGVIRPYKGLPDAVEAVLGVPEARLLVAGDPRIPLDGLRQQPAIVPNGGSGTSARPRSSGRSAPRPSPSFRIGPSSISPARFSRRSAPACRPSSTTSAASASSSARSEPAGSSRRETSRPAAGSAGAARRSATRSPRLARAPAAHARRSPGTTPRPPTSRCTRSSCEARPERPLPRARRTPARPVRDRRRRAARRGGRGRGRLELPALQRTQRRPTATTSSSSTRSPTGCSTSARPTRARSTTRRRALHGRVHPRGDAALPPLCDAARRSRRVVATVTRRPVTAPGGSRSS